MSDLLYQKSLLRLAARATGAGRLEPRDATATVSNPLCGDRVTIDLRCTDGRIAAVAHDTRACVLCQASATLIAERGPGLDRAAARAVAEAVRAFLARPADGPPPGWEDFSAMAPVADVPSRHRCVLLPFDALDRALAAVEDDDGTGA